VSRNTRRELVEAGASPSKVFSVFNGVDKEVFKPMNKDYAKTLVEENTQGWAKRQGIVACESRTNKRYSYTHKSCCHAKKNLWR
jgi:hypothetical protein